MGLFFGLKSQAWESLAARKSNVTVILTRLPLKKSETVRAHKGAPFFKGTLKCF